MNKNLERELSPAVKEASENGCLPFAGPYTYAPIVKGFVARVLSGANVIDIATGLFPKDRNMSMEDFRKLSSVEQQEQGVERCWITVATDRGLISLRALLSGGSFGMYTAQAFIEAHCCNLFGKWITCTDVSSRTTMNGREIRSYKWSVSDTEPESET